MGKGCVLLMNAYEGAGGYYGQLRLVILYSCFKLLLHDFILNKTLHPFKNDVYEKLTVIRTFGQQLAIWISPFVGRWLISGL